jgi:MYXO-CTERM domain-containing protein
MLLRTCLPMTCALAITSAWLALGARDARACGGCFHQPPGPTEVESTLVTDHRMVLSISPVQTVLWDQIRYSGTPSSFAWVLPVKPGARIELSDDAWIAALDAATQAVVVGPSTSCGGAPVDYEDGNGGGCASSSEGASEAFAPGAADEDAGADSQVQVVSQQTVGPYDAVTVQSSQGEALGDWLRANGYAVPASIQPTIDAFTSEGFDFIALKLAPGQGVQAMQPVRVVTPGANLSLPLRMVAAGTGPTVGIELFVLSEGRYHPQNFPDAVIDFSQLAWDPYQSISNYSQLATTAMAAVGGTAWLTESSQPLSLYVAGPYNPALGTTYQSTCVPTLSTMCSSEAGAGPEASAPEAGGGEASAGDGGVAEAGALDGGAAAPDAGGSGDDDGGCMPTGIACDDLDLATSGMDVGSTWITRMRASLPQVALANDLVLEAAPSQQSVPSVHRTNLYTVPNYNPCPATSNGASTGASGAASGGCACRTADQVPRARYADFIIAGMLAVALAGAARRRRRA